MTKNKQLPRDEYPDELAREEEGIFSQDDFSERPPSDIVAFNELRSCADLVRMYESKQLTIKPDFQRDIVWSNAAQTRFIDSLTKQLPIPSMCISLDYRTNKRLVIDGLQRMWSIIRFLTDDTWKLSTLKDIDGRLSGRRMSYIREHNRKMYGQVENLTIPVTVLRCDNEKTNHMEYLFTIFHRLNTGANRLSNQEIRNCIYSGTFNELLKRSVKNEMFRDLFGLDAKKTYRYVFEEFALRFYAFADSYEDYDGNLSQYLNTYMERGRKEFDDVVLRQKHQLFERTVDIIFDRITRGAALPKLSKATIEAVFVGIGRNIDSVEEKTKPQLKAMFKSLRVSDEFSPDNLKNAITTKSKLIARMNRAVRIFAE